MVIAVRTSKPIVSRADLEDAQRTLNDRRQRVVHAVTRMNGARAIPESLARRRLFIGNLPGMGQENKRDLSCLTLHAADLLPIETPWRGTPQSPLLLLDTPYRQLIPFSPYDPAMGDANMLFMAKSGGGKTFMAQMFLLMMARANPLIFDRRARRLVPSACRVDGRARHRSGSRGIRDTEPLGSAAE
jgi:hypothetical protein